jgi:asparagine synthase (glutamine-hydrolysing)
MCGILGSYSINSDLIKVEKFYSALNSLKHRGPNDKGLERFDLSKGKLFLGHSRLSIIDLSEAGHQPMFSQDKMYSIVFNGEIYNYLELRKELQNLGYVFRTETDTEVLLNAWIEWGERCLKKFVGMFAFAIFDIVQEKLFCARDAFGIKPFFYSIDNNEFNFASEITSIIHLLNKKPEIDNQKALNYLVYTIYDNDESSFFAGIKQLMPGHFFIYNIAESYNRPKYENIRWWWPEVNVRKDITFEQAAIKLRELFLKSVELHLRSDVPIGAALSGGIDSSAVVCSIRYLHPKIPIHTFTYIAKGSSINEERWADIVNDYVGAIPHKIVVSSSELMDDIDNLVIAQGEPFSTLSIYAQNRVFREAKRSGITVILDGQGADEMLGGYTGYPSQVLSEYIKKAEIRNFFTFLNNHSERFRVSRFIIIKSFIGYLLPEGIKSWFKMFIFQNSLLIKNKIRLKSIKSKKIKDKKDSYGRDLAKELRHDLTSGRINRLLRYEDRNSMCYSIESRVPFLTIEIAEFLLSLPSNFLVSETAEPKKLFRAAMRGIVPDEILDRKDKVGFETPDRSLIIAAWPSLKNSLNFSLLSDFINSNAVMDFIENSLKSDRDYDDMAWRIILFCKWISVIRYDKDNILD